MISKLAPAITALSRRRFLIIFYLKTCIKLKFNFIIFSLNLSPIQGELTISEGIEHQFTVEEMDDETYTGLLIYK